MQKIWELYALATTIIQKLCQNKCRHLTIPDVIEECQDYIKRRIESNNFQALRKYDPNRGAKESSYLHTVISSRLIDFFNSAKKNREISSEFSINSRSYEANEIPHDIAEILDSYISTLSNEEKLYIKLRFTDDLSYKEIGEIFGITHKQASKKLENIHKKLRTKIQKSGLKLEDIL